MKIFLCLLSLSFNQSKIKFLVWIEAVFILCFLSFLLVLDPHLVFFYRLMRPLRKVETRHDRKVETRHDGSLLFHNPHLVFFYRLMRHLRKVETRHDRKVETRHDGSLLFHKALLRKYWIARFHKANELQFNSHIVDNSI